MAVVTSVATVSVKYYTKRGKSFTVRAIRDMVDSLLEMGVTEGFPVAVHISDKDLTTLPAEKIARIALQIHDLYPEQTDAASH